MLMRLLKGRPAGKPAQAGSPTSAAGARKVVILTPPHTVYLAHLVFKCLSEAGFDVSINVGEHEGEFGGLHFVVLCPQVFRRLPDSFIAFQMEQAGSSWFDQGYLSLLQNPGVRVLEYSALNLPFLRSKDVPVERVRVAQLTMLPDYPAFLAEHRLFTAGPPGKDFDVLFYGGINERRFTALSKLDREFRLKVATNAFGPGLYELISRSRVVVNLHFGDESPLESTRIFEALSLGARIVSEDSTDSATYRGLDTRVSFVRSGDTDGAIQAIRRALQDQRAAPPGDAAAFDEFSRALEWAVSALGWRGRA